MKMRAFEYHRPMSIGEAVAVLSEFGDDAKVLAGGQSLLPMMAMRLGSPAHVVDIGRIPEFMSMMMTDSHVRVPAMVRHCDVENWPATIRLLNQAAPLIGHRAIRSRGSVCGSIAHGDPAAEWPAVAVALDATIVIRGENGERTVAAKDFFKGFLSTDVGPDELVTEVCFPRLPSQTGSAIHEIARRHGDFAVCGAIAVTTLGPTGLIENPSLAAFGVGQTPQRMSAAENLLRGQRPTPELFASAAAAVSSDVDPPTDGHAPASYRRHVVGVLMKRALVDATAMAGV